MRDLINIVEEGTSMWEARQSPESLREAARDHFGACDDGSLTPDDADWTFEPAYPLDKLPVPKEGWEAWWEGEKQISLEYGLTHRLDFEHEPITEAIYVSEDAGHVQIWDGWHRAGGSIVSGRTTIPAVVGRRKKD